MHWTLSLTCALFTFAVVSASEKTEDWSYRPTSGGVFGPSEWSKVEGASCGGKRQSPIDIIAHDSCDLRKEAPLVFAGACDNYNVTQTYEGFKNEAVQSTCSVSVQNKAYAYLQSHIHLPSEHKLNGKQYDGEMHFVHKSETGLLVIGIFFKVCEPGKSTIPFLSNLLAGLDKVTPTSPNSLSLGSYSKIVKSSLKGGRVFNYPGSLTTPGCGETVDWWVVEHPVSISKADLEALRKQRQRVESFDDGRGARPVQPLNGRTITVY